MLPSDDDQNDYFRKLHAFEQAAANMRPITAMLASYMNALAENGFTRPEALKMVMRLQDKILGAAFDQKIDPEE